MPALSKGFFEGHDNLNASHQADGKPNGSSRPADECPYPRPFPVGFNKCPTFRPQPFNPMDMSDRPLAPMLTCGNLITRTIPNGKVGWYAACKLGDAAARQRLAAVRAS
jgi:hypothetical protein